MKCFTLTVLVIIAAAIAVPQGEKIISVAVASQGQGATCSPWLRFCNVYEDCCRHLTCQFYLAKCIPKSGLIVPGADKRPLGPGPYPPNVPKNELPY